MRVISGSVNRVHGNDARLSAVDMPACPPPMMAIFGRSVAAFTGVLFLDCVEDGVVLTGLYDRRQCRESEENWVGRVKVEEVR